MSEVMSDFVTCPHCGEISNLGGLIGVNTNDCPRCGKPVLGNEMKLEVIKTNNGYMVEDDTGDYVCDMNGDNLFDTYTEAEDLMNQYLMTFGTDADNGMGETK